MNSGRYNNQTIILSVDYLRLYLVCAGHTARRPAYINCSEQMRLTARIPYPAVYVTEKKRRLSVHRPRTYGAELLLLSIGWVHEAASGREDARRRQSGSAETDTFGNALIRNLVTRVRGGGKR